VTDQDRQEAQELIERHYLGALDTVESERLEELLLQDKNLRDDFRHAAALDSALRDASLTPVAATPPTPKAFSGQWIAIAAAAIIILGTLPFILPKEQPVTEPQPIASTTNLPAQPTLEQRISELIPMPQLSDEVVESEVATIESVSGSATITPYEGEPRVAAVGETLRNGSTVRTLRGDGRVKVRLWDRSTVELATGTALTVTRQDGQFRLIQPEGQIVAEVEPQQQDKPLTIETPSSVVTVLGTRFTLVSSPTNDAATSGSASNFKLVSRLFVEEGRVAIADKVSNKSVEVTANETAYVEKGVELKVESVNELLADVKILRATYGQGTDSLDVTTAIQSRTNSLRLITTGPFNLLAGDPSPQTPKSLHVDYVIDGRKFSHTFDEWENRRQARMNTELTLPVEK
jgi:ferric-dicitrate binding protein FerR (iron transport regulator)